MGRWLINLCGIAAVLLLAACGGGGGGTSTSGDIVTGGPRAPAPATGLDRFLLYPNPLARADGVFEVGAAEYATAYYEAIDPANQKDTLAKWKVANNIGVTTGGHVEHAVIIGDQRDLGYGRRMIAHQNPDGSMAFMVENYLVGAYGGYTPLNLEAAIQRVSQWHLGTNAIEFSPGPGAAPGSPARFVKFYTYDPVTGARLTTLSLDGRPAKAMPTVCISCHGGRGDPLTPPDAAGKRLFPLVMNGFSQHRGDVQAQLHPFEAASFDYSTLPGYSRAEQEASIKAINKMVLCSFSLPFGTLIGPATPAEDQCRRVATRDEYQGTASVHLKDMYGGTGLPNATTFATDTYVEPTWVAAGQSNLYLNVQAQVCRVCHLLRGTGNESGIDFDTFAKFDSYQDRIKVHIADRGNMPLAKLIYDKFWSTVSMFQAMGNYLVSAGFSDGAAMPGRPLADPGPGRVMMRSVATGTATASLSAAMSLYADTFQWSLLGGPAGGAILTNPATAQPIFSATINGTYTVQLVASQGGTSSPPVNLSIAVVDENPANPLLKAPSTLRFADIKAVLVADCASCHQQGGDTSVNPPAIPPIWYTAYDRSGSGNAATNDDWYYTELRGRINFTDIVASPLLRKPSGNHHFGGLRGGFNASLPPGTAGRANYDMFLNWILNGAPE